MLSTRGFCFILPVLFYPVHYVNAEWVEYINDASLNVTHTDNLNQSAFSADEEADTYITPSYTFGRFYQATDLTRLRLSASVSANSHNEFSKLNSVDINGAVAVSHKFGIGWKKPWLRGEVSTGYKQAKLDLRDSNLYQIGVSTGKRLNKRLSAQASLKYNKRNGGSGKVAVDGKSTQVFDINNSTLGVNVDYLLGERSQLSAGFTHRNGEFDSACTPGNVATVLKKADVKAITVDDVFGGCVYRLDGSSNALRLQYSYGLSRHSSLNLGYEKRKGKADDLEYDTSLWNLSIMYSQ